MATQMQSVAQLHPVQLQCSYTIGRAEFSGPGFRVPVGIARDAGNRLYVLNRSYEGRPDGKRVTICTVDEAYISEFGRGVSTEQAESEAPDGHFMWATSIALDRAGNVYVSDEWYNRISIFTRDGDWLGKWGTPGAGDGQLNRPSGMAFDRDDNLYVVDSQNNRVQKFTKDGAFLLKWGTTGDTAGAFDMPWGIALDSAGDVYITDWRNDRVQKFSPDGRFLMQFGTSGSGDGELSRPTGIAVDQAGVIYVADWRNDRLQVFDAEGNFVAKLLGEATISQWGREKLNASPEMLIQRQKAQGLEREKQFWGPMAVTVDDENRVFVAESVRSRIQVYLKQIPYFIGDRL